jgi:hypothetical protein
MTSVFLRRYCRPMLLVLLNRNLAIPSVEFIMGHISQAPGLTFLPSYCHNRKRGNRRLKLKKDMV